jgi:DUF1680 family protein
VPSDLYHYSDQSEGQVTLEVNGEPIDLEIHKGFAVIDRKWSKGDVINLNLPMPVRRIRTHQNVEDNRNKVAVVRGPIVYCAEEVDNGTKVVDLILPDDTKLQSKHNSDLLNGVTVITGNVVDEAGKQRELTAIPYYAWAHRGSGKMAVWLWRK